jgi:hypothetical protein
MNTQMGRIMMAAVLISIAISAPSLLAQTTRMSATIPFDFYVSDQLFPAGTYTVAPEARADAVRLFDSKGNSVFVMTRGQSDNKAINYSRLVFRKYGDTAFLASIFWEGYKTGRDLPSSDMEKKIAEKGSSTPVAVQLKK